MLAEVSDLLKPLHMLQGPKAAPVNHSWLRNWFCSHLSCAIQGCNQQFTNRQHKINVYIILVKIDSKLHHVTLGLIHIADGGDKADTSDSKMDTGDLSPPAKMPGVDAPPLPPPPGGPVEIVFSFDTTGSMSSCLGQVSKQWKFTGDNFWNSCLTHTYAFWLLS